MTGGTAALLGLVSREQACYEAAMFTLRKIIRLLRSEDFLRHPIRSFRDLYRRASVVLMAGEEDFGIVPVEAQACGTPVVALARGGALETVVPDATGALVEADAPQAFADAIAQTLDRRFDPRAIRAHAERFSRARFIDEMSALVTSAISSEAAR